jgi:excisionase family DNA binding protein
MPKPPPPQRRYATIADAAQYLKVSDPTLRAMIKQGRITGYRNGTRLVRVDLNEIDANMVPFGGGR